MKTKTISLVAGLVTITVILSRMAMASSCVGTLSGSVTTYTTNQSINLTTLGVNDWAVFGYTANATSIARKSSGGSQISSLSQVGTQTLANYNNAAYRTWLTTWSDGASPNSTATNEAYLVFSGNGPANGAGLSFTVPADTTLRTLTVYVEVSNNTTTTTQGKLTAALSDGSAVPYSDTSVGTVSSDTNGKLGVYTISYQAANLGQMLAINWTNNTSNGQNVQIYAATLKVPSTAAAPVAFPGAEGFGAVTRGAAGGSSPKVIHVITTSDTCTGCGSFRDALTASGPRYVVFDTGGTITLTSAIVVSNPYLTIACQTAPGGGIQFTTWAVRFVNTHDIIVRYCKSRSGSQASGNDYTTDHVGFDVAGSGGATGETVAATSNVIIDHSDMEFASRDNMDTWDNVQNLTVQRSIMADAIQSSNSSYGYRGYNLGGTADSGLNAYDTTGVSVHHNLFAHNNQRNPDIRTVGYAEVVNNVMYDYGSFGLQTDNALASDNTVNTSFANKLNVIGNYFQAGGITYSSRLEVTIDTTQNAGLWVYDNISPHRTSATPTTLASNWQVVGDVSVASPNDPSPGTYAQVEPPTNFQASTPFVMSNYPITTQNHSLSTLTVFNNVLADVGANKNVTSTSRPHINASSDALTLRMISETQNANGSAAPSTYPAGTFVTYPTLATGTTLTDTDCDGIPDDVETAAGLSTSHGNCSTGLGGDSLLTNPATGYTYLEDYINGNGGIN